MKKLEQITVFHVFILLLLGILSTSCEENEADLGYIGNWQYTAFIEYYVDDIKDAIFTKQRGQATFTEHSYSELIQVWNPYYDEWLDYISINASINVNEGEIRIEVNELGMSPDDMWTKLPTGKIEYYKPGNPEFDIISDSLIIPHVYYGELYVNDNIMTLRLDYNGDGDFDDGFERQNYRRY